MQRRKFLKGLAAGAAGATASTSVLTPDAAAAVPSGNSNQPTRDKHGCLVERYTGDSRVRSGMALGGIGTGFLELRKDGRFYNWSIFNNFPKETGPEFTLPVGEEEDPMASNLFFTVRYEVEGEEPKIKLLQLSNGMNEGGIMGIAYLFPWMQAVDSIDYSARFPFARLRFTATDMPFDLDLEAWSPFIPHDVKNSALPVVNFDFTIVSKTSKKIHILLMMTACNNVGYDNADRFYTTAIHEDPTSKSVTMSCGGVDPGGSTSGEIVLSSLASGSSHYCGWGHRHPYYEYVLRHRSLPNLDDTNGTESMGGELPAWMPATQGRNHIDTKTGPKKAHDPRLYCTLARSFELSTEVATVNHSFLYSWNFPNLYAEKSFRERSQTVEGHYYSNYFKTAMEVATYAKAQRSFLYKPSRKFLDDFFDSSADVVVLEQINSQLNTFVTNGRLVKSGDFGILEGLASTWSWGPVATIDVMLYGTAPIIALFPELQKSTMRCHRRAQSAQGEINHGLLKNFKSGEDGTAGVSHRLDLAGQYVILVMRDYFWTHDKEYLREQYPSMQKAISYIIEHRSFPGEELPLMRGIESSYDNFPMYGYSAYLLSQWLCAIASLVQAAEVMSDPASKTYYQKILENSQSRMQAKLWNGKYYRLYNDEDRSGGRGDSSDGCLTDQLIGQWTGHQVGLGHLLKKENVDTALTSILTMSYKPEFGLRNCSWLGNGYWSDVDRDTWVDQGNTCWSGVELAFASFLLYEGFYHQAIEVIKTVDQRYRKNGLYWDHQEFGGHYFRPMSAWAIVNGLLGFSINQGKYRFSPHLKQTSFKLFFATPTGTAHFVQSGKQVALRCLTGSLEFDVVEIRGNYAGEASLRGATTPDQAIPVQPGGGAIAGQRTWAFGKKLVMRSGDELVLT